MIYNENFKRAAKLDIVGVVIGFLAGYFFDSDVSQVCLLSKVAFIVASFLYCAAMFSILIYQNLFNEIKNAKIYMRLQSSVFSVQMTALSQYILCALFLILAVFIDNNILLPFVSWVSVLLSFMSLFVFTICIIWATYRAQELKDMIDHEKKIQ